MMSHKPQQQRNAMLLRLKQVTVGVIGVTQLLMAGHALAAKKTVKADATANNEIREMIGNGETCQGQIGSPSTLTLPLGKSTLIKLPEPLASRSIGDPGVLQSKMIAAQTLYLLGMNIGSTNMIIQGKSGTCTIVDVIVTLDPDALQKTLAELLPEEKNIKVTAAADSIVLTGTVEDALTANRVVDIAQAYVRRRVMPVNPTGEINNNQMAAGGGQQGQQGGARNQEFVNPRIVNMLGISAQQQVMLEVKVAEVSKSLLDKLGVDLAAAKLNGNSSFFYNVIPGLIPGLGTPSLGGSPNSPTGAIIPRFTDSPNIGASTGSRDSFRSALIDAEKRDGLVKILAEPSIMAISGQEGSFLAGGRIFIPVAQNNNNGGITLEEKEFGVGVKFTPTVLAGGRINLKVAPEVSELNREGVGIASAGITGTAVLPAFTTRKASTTVQLFDGQSFAIGGLIKNNSVANIKALPILGEIPIIGALFRSTDFQNDKTELLFVITPRLVKPINNQAIQLPTDRHVDPSRTDLFLKGKLEGDPKEAPAPKVDPSKAVVQPKENDTTQPGFDTK